MNTPAYDVTQDLYIQLTAETHEVARRILDRVEAVQQYYSTSPTLATTGEECASQDQAASLSAEGTTSRHPETA